MRSRGAFGAAFGMKLAAAVLITVAVFALAMVFGAADTSPLDVWRAISSGAAGEKLDVIRDLRLPRELGAVFVGAALAVSGAVMQGMTRNPLADPGLLGLTAGASAALAAIIAWKPAAGYYVIMVACFIGAAAGAALVFGLGALRRGGFAPARMVLAGAAVSAFLFAVSEGIGLLFKISKDISLWTSGGLIGTTWSQLQIIVPFICAGILLALLLSRQLTILSLNEEVALGLGQRTAVIKAALFAVTVMLAGASVALIGNIAFIGLLVPHVVRRFAGTHYRAVLPVSVFAGASFMLAADTIARTLNAPYETPIVAVVAVLGLPFFLFVARKGGRSF